MDADFIESRARGLESWLQRVLDFGHEEAVPPESRAALAAFLQPLVRLPPNDGDDSGLELMAAVARAVDSFCAAHFAAGRPPSPPA